MSEDAKGRPPKESAPNMSSAPSAVSNSKIDMTSSLIPEILQTVAAQSFMRGPPDPSNAVKA